MSDAYSNALKRKAELNQELAEVEQFLALYERFSGGTEPERVPTPLRSSQGPSVRLMDIGDNRSTMAKRRVRGRPNAIADYAEKVIRETGRPMQRGDLVEALEAAGIKIPSADKARYVGTILWRHKDKFRNTGDGYALADMALTEE